MSMRGEQVQIRPKSRFYYGWIIVLLTFATLLVSAGIRSLPSVLIVPFQQGTDPRRHGQAQPQHGKGSDDHFAEAEFQQQRRRKRADQAVKKDADRNDARNAGAAPAEIFPSCGWLRIQIATAYAVIPASRVNGVFPAEIGRQFGIQRQKKKLAGRGAGR